MKKLGFGKNTKKKLSKITRAARHQNGGLVLPSKTHAAQAVTMKGIMSTSLGTYKILGVESAKSSCNCCSQIAGSYTWGPIRLLATLVPVAPPVAMTSTFRRTNSPARSGSRSSFPSAYRHSITMFWLSRYSSSRKPWRNASIRAESTETERLTDSRLGAPFLAAAPRLD